MVRRDARPGPRLRYSVIFELSGKVDELRAEFTHYEPPSKLVIRMTGGKFPRDAYAEEMYELSEDRGQTLLTQRVIVQNSGINVFFRLIIFIIRRFGRPVEKRFLGTLKELVEKSRPDEALDRKQK